ncbi:MAG: hypothetical protein D4R63_11460 [Methylococcaceae bacterium]|nr:MAG: hypothetical protein D4R63_11460 [Methylococcaceae bacterium]
MTSFTQHSQRSAQHSSIAIIGSGFSGTMVAVHLLRQASFPLTIYLIEANPAQFARGVAYSTDSACHLLNVPAANMSAFPKDPVHFLRWAKKKEAKGELNVPWQTESNTVTATSFLPRGAYGDYLVELLDNAEHNAVANGVYLERKIDKAVALRIEPKSVMIGLLNGEHLRVQKVVLALGNFPPGDPVIENPVFYQSPRYFSNPWQRGVLQALLKTTSCVLIGSGLTMVDWAITLSNAGYQGVIHTVSRRGVWPQEHKPHKPLAFSLDVHAKSPSVRAWLHEIRRYIRESDCDWRSVIDALRPSIGILWTSLSLVERRRFLRHVRVYWDNHRHRLPPVVAERLNELVRSGQLQKHTGRIFSYQETEQGVEVLIKQRGLATATTLSVSAVVNCSGAESNYRKLNNLFVTCLLSQQSIEPDPLALGLNVGSDGALIYSDGTHSECLYTLGPPQKGMLWETIAVPEIRVQAEQLANTLLTHLPNLTSTVEPLSQLETV